MTFLQLGSIFDRAVQLCAHNLRPIALCMAPAALTQLIAAFVRPWVPATPQSLAANGFVPVLLYAVFSALALFTQWFCVSSLTYGVRAISSGQPPDPTSWLRAGLRRTAAILVTFLLPITASAIFLIPVLITISRLNQVITDIHVMDLQSLEFQLTALPFEELGALVILVVVIPFACIATAATLLGEIRVLPAIVLALRTCFSRAYFLRFVALSGAIVALFGAYLAVGIALEMLYRFFPGSLVLYESVGVVAGLAISAYGAVVVALAWLGRYLGPESS